MKYNCSNHLIDEIKLLKLNLVVFHGLGSQNRFLGTLKERKFDAKPISSVTANYGEVLFDVRPLETILLFLAHPSYGHLKRQWETVVVPSLAYLREHGLIPR